MSLACAALSCSEQKPHDDSPAQPATTPRDDTGRAGAGGSAASGGATSGGKPSQPASASEPQAGSETPASFGTDESPEPQGEQVLGGAGAGAGAGAGGAESEAGSSADAGAAGEATDCTNALPATDSAPATLQETGLYTAPGIGSYEPAYALWADGSGKDRYIYLPPCSQIETSDMDHWQLPVGARLWKHFEVDGKRVETRLLHRYGPSSDDWLMATYGWDAARPNDPAAATLVLHGQPNAQGTLHDIPDPSACPSCHGKLPERVLGFGAIQLSHGGAGLTLEKLNREGRLSVPPPQGIQVPGTSIEQAALGYLHANCGGCHNQQGQIPRENPMLLRLSVSEHVVADTNLVRTTLGVATINGYPELHGKPRIDPGSPETSAIFLRMSDRNKFPMPPLASKFADTEGGVAALRAWIEALPH